MTLNFRQRLAALFTGQVEDSPRVVPTVRRQVVGSWNGMTFALWQTSPEHIKWAQDLFKQEKFRDLLAVLSNACPTFAAQSLDNTQALVHLGRVLGFQDLFRVLLALPRMPEQVVEDLHADYSEPDSGAWEPLNEQL